MKPEYWIATMAFIGAVIGRVIFALTGQFDSGSGAVIGMLIGIVLYIRSKESQRKR